MSLAKVAPNDTCYCFKFFKFLQNLKNKATRAKKTLIFIQMVKDTCFSAPAALFLRFCQNEIKL